MSDKNNLIRGQAALGMVLFFVSLSLIVIGTFATLGITQIQAANEALLAKRALATTESGTEDALYRMTQVAFAKPVVGVPYTVTLNNGGTANVILNSVGDLSNLSYSIQVQGQASGRHRNTNINFNISSGSGLVHVDNPVQSGYLGLEMFNGAGVVSSEGSGKGSVFSNGSIFGESGAPYVDGDATVAMGIGDAPWPYLMHNENITDAEAKLPGHSIDLGFPDVLPYITIAQSFVPNITADIQSAHFFVKKVGNIQTDLLVRIYGNQRVEWSFDCYCYIPCTDLSDYCEDLPKQSTVKYYGSIKTSLLSQTTYNWAIVDFTKTGTQEPLFSNEKYWIVFISQCPRLGCSAGTAGWSIAGLDKYVLGSQDYYLVPDKLQHKVVYFGPEPGLVAFSGDFGGGWGNENNYLWEEDINPAFKIFMGEAQTSIDGSAAGGDLNIVGSAKAQGLYGLHAHDAYYNTAGSALSNFAVFANSVPCGDLSPYSNEGCHYIRADDVSNPNYPPSSKNIGPFDMTKYRELRKKAASMGTTTGDVILNASLGQRNAGSATTYLPGKVKPGGTIINKGVIDGDLTVKGYARLELTGRNYSGGASTTCPYNEQNGKAGKECYVLRVMGDLNVLNSGEITVSCPSPCAADDAPSAHIIVDGKIKIQNNADIHGVTTSSGQSGMFLTSYAPYVKSPYAIDLLNNISGSVYYAMRGGILVENNMTVKAIAAPFVSLQNNATVTFDAGLINPYSEDGGVQPIGGISITDFREGL
ncbi:MAG: hypothetical protein AAB482_03100 [Patescibacteria group bacterium]